MFKRILMAAILMAGAVTVAIAQTRAETDLGHFGQ